jgi:fucose permease
MSAKYTDSQTQKLLMHILAQNAELSAKEKEVIVETLLTNKRILLTKATIKDTASQLANNAAHALKNPLVYGTIAAITALVAITYAHVKAQNADAEAAKQAAKAAEKLRDSANEAKQELQDIQNTIDAYDSAIKTLDECTKGTDEWRDALKEVNE